jgi:hypothetical protein
MFQEDEIECLEATYGESLTVEGDGSLTIRIDSSALVTFSMNGLKLKAAVSASGPIEAGLQILLDTAALKIDVTEVGMLLVLAEEARAYVENEASTPLPAPLPTLRRQICDEGRQLIKASMEIEQVSAPLLKRQLSDEAKNILHRSMEATDVKATFVNQLPQNVVISQLKKRRHSGVTAQVQGVLKLGQQLQVDTVPGAMWRAQIEPKGPSEAFAATWDYIVSDGDLAQRFVIGSEHRPRFIASDAPAPMVRNVQAQYLTAVKELAALVNNCTASGVIDVLDAQKVLCVLIAAAETRLGAHGATSLTTSLTVETSSGEEEIGHIARVSLRSRCLRTLMYHCKAGIFSVAQSKACTRLIKGLGSVQREEQLMPCSAEELVQEARALAAVHGKESIREVTDGTHLELELNAGSAEAVDSPQCEAVGLHFHIMTMRCGHFSGVPLRLRIRSQQAEHVAVLSAIIRSMFICRAADAKDHDQMVELLLQGVEEGALSFIVECVQDQLQSMQSGGVKSAEARPSAQIELAKNKAWHDFQYETAGLDLEAFTIPSIDRIGRACLQRALKRTKGVVVTDIENVLSVPLLNQFRSRLATIRGQCTDSMLPALSPVLAFHSTPDASAINSIVEAGVLAPGDLIRSTGELLPMRHGARFGQGVYLSPDLKLSEQYGFVDSEGSRQILYCMVAMGSTQFIKDAFSSQAAPPLVYVIDGPHRGKKGYLQKRKHFGLLQLEAREAYPVVLGFTNKQTHIVGSMLQLASDLQKPAVDGRYFDLFHSRTSEDQMQYIAANSEQVLPLFLVTYHTQGHLARYRNPVGEAAASLGTIKLLPLQPEVLRSKQKYEARKIASRNNSWVLSIARSRLMDAGFPMPPLLTTRLVLFVDCRAGLTPILTKAALPFCSTLMKDMGASTCSVAFHGETEASFHPDVTSSSFFGEQALQFAKQVSAAPSDPAAAKANLGLQVALDKAIEVMVTQHHRGIRDQKLEVYEAAYARLLRCTMPPMSKSLTSFIRKLLANIVSKAVSLGEMRRPENVKSYEREMAFHMAQVMAERGRGELYVAVFVTSKHARGSSSSGGGSSNSSSNSSSKANEAYGRFLKEQRNYVRGSHLNVVVKVVGLGNDVCFRTALQAKSVLETVEHYEPRSVYHCTKPIRHFPDTAKELVQDLASAVTKGHAVSVSCVDAPIGSGFITDLTRPPVWTVPILLPSRGGEDGANVSLLYQGPVAPRQIRLAYGTHAHGAGFLVSCGVSRKAREGTGRNQQGEGRVSTPDWVAADQERKWAEQQFRLQLGMLVLLQAITGRIKVAAVAQRVTVVDDPAFLKVKELLAAAKSVVVGDDIVLALTKRSPMERMAAMKQKRKLLGDLEAALNDVSDAVRRIQSKESLKGAAVGEWLQHASVMRHGKRLLRRVEKESHISRDSVVAELVRLESRLGLATNSGGDDASTGVDCFGLRFQDELLQLVATAAGTPLSTMDLLYAIGGSGVQIGVQRSEASNIDPWLLIVSLISNLECRTAEAMCMLDCGYSLTDGAGHAAADVLVLLRPDGTLSAQETYFRSQLHACYLATVFTRNPLLYLPTQRSAILVISFVKAAEQILRQKILADQGGGEATVFDTESAASQVETMLHIMFTFRQFVRGHVADRWQPICDKLMSDTPHECLLETQSAEEASVSSVCQPLAALCCLDEGNFLSIPPHRLSRIAMALLGEAVSRSCRVFVRAKHAESHPSSQANTMPTARRLIRQALGIKLSSCLSPTAASVSDDPALAKAGAHSDDFNVAAGKAASWRFFSNTWTNCTPWAIVSCIGVARVLWEWVTAQAIPFEAIMTDPSARRMLANHLLGAFATGQISMRGFAHQHVRNAKPVKLQIAMYVQGLRYYSSRSRREGMISLDDADEVLRSLAREERLTVYMERLHKKCKQAADDAKAGAALGRLQRRQLEQEEFLLTHGYPHLPTTFTILQVEQMNKRRPANDQLVRTYSGLLRDRCCFPNCPFYLHDMRTDNDRKTGSQTGLYAHLGFLVGPDRHYLQGLHVQARSWLSRKSHTKGRSAFVKYMKEHFESDQPSAFKAGATEWLHTFADLYDQLSSS